MKTHFLLGFIIIIQFSGVSQNIAFEEYDLSNGLHVILHQDTSVPLVSIGVSYHVGSKDEDPSKTGFAHFFEHLLFEGTKNIERGAWDKLVAMHGGNNNATTNQDRTYYYENFPSNSLELGLWLESERLLHPIINQKGVTIQKEVVQEERRMRIDNTPYGRWQEQMFKNLFTNHPYKWPVIGSMDHLASATLEDFKKFKSIYYVPNNAVLVVSGDLQIPKTKELIERYFATIPSGASINKKVYKETPLSKAIETTFVDQNIQIPLVMLGYRTPAMHSRDAYVLNMISSYLSDGKSSVLYKTLVDEKELALQIFAFNFSLEDYGAYIVGGLPVADNSLEAIRKEVDAAIFKIQTALIKERDYQKLQNKFETDFVQSNSSVTGIAKSLANYYQLYNNTNLINTEIAIYKSITREEIKKVASKYLKLDQRVLLNYIPKGYTIQ